jgi:hypothetical protein
MKMNHLKVEIALFKIKQGCMKCGYNKNSKALQFAHRDQSEKYRNKNGKVVHPSDMIKGKHRSRYGKDTIWTEISKCDILCANCHAEQTFS